MNSVYERSGRAEVNHQESQGPTGGSSLARLSPNTRRPLLEGTEETQDTFLTRAGPAGKTVHDGLSFLSVKNAIRVYPDTGESGEAYDAEAFLDC